ncbi:MAG: hypothetical protein IPM33_06125 [Phycisphaerales bacterium]|nr:hypothetical protein [Phycisphaerales bacterium]
MSDTPAPEARSQWRPRVRRFFRLLRHPIAGLLALAAIVVSCHMLPEERWSASPRSHWFRPFLQSQTITSSWSITHYVELRDTGPVIHAPLSWGVSRYPQAARKEHPPVFSVVSNGSRTESGYWAPWRRTDELSMQLQPVARQHEENLKDEARRAMAAYYVRNTAGPHPPNFDPGDGTKTIILWGGFVWNAATLFAAGVFLWSFSGVPAWIRLRRARREGLCVHCLYPLAGLAPAGAKLTCPECGRAHSA